MAGSLRTMESSFKQGMVQKNYMQAPTVCMKHNLYAVFIEGEILTGGEWLRNEFDYASWLAVWVGVVYQRLTAEIK